VIEEKIKNSLSLDYPGGVEILVGDDASTDKTVEKVERFKNVRIIKFKKRQGKMGVLNQLVKEASNNILIFTDANSIFKQNALKKLVPHLSSSLIGCVGGKKEILPEGSIGKEENKYWKWESFLKNMEAKFFSTFVDGAIYALKKEVYPYPPVSSIIMDDFAVSLGVINKGYRVVFEPEAIAYETASKRLKDEFRRKIRIIKGAITVVKVFSIKKMILQIVSHKILRWGTGVFVLGLTIGNVFLREGIYLWFLYAQLACYGMLILSGICEAFKISYPKIGKSILYFWLTITAQIVGMIKYMKGERKAYWQRLERW
jgi:cellulose synthase/poly-beta-1,6-N-acetylglucosamine synthase-like glycosyltransferase